MHHEKLIEYGVVSSKRSSTIKEKLDALELVEDEDYRLRDIPQNLPQGGRPKSILKILHPTAASHLMKRVF